MFKCATRQIHQAPYSGAPVRGQVGAGTRRPHQLTTLGTSQKWATLPRGDEHAWQLSGGATDGRWGITVNRVVLPLAWYRFRTTFAHRWGSYLTLIFVVGLLGGLAMGSVAAARRTQSSFPTFLAGTNPSDLIAPTAVYNPAVGSYVGYDPGIINVIAHLPHVRHVESWALLNVVPLGPNGAPLLAPLPSRTPLAVLTGSSSTRTGSPSPMVGWPIQNSLTGSSSRHRKPMGCV